MTNLVATMRSKINATRLLDPNDPKYVTGSQEEQKQAREDWRRAMRVRKVVASDRTEIPRAKLKQGPFGLLEHDDGTYYRPVGGDPDHLPDAHHYYVTENGDIVLLEPPASGPKTRAELEQQQRDRDERRHAPKPKPAWMR
jgi:hypothetical protein